MIFYIYITVCEKTLQDSHDIYGRTANTRHQESRHRTYRTQQARQDSRDMTGWTGKQGYDSQNRTAETNIRDRTSGIVQPGHDSRDKTAWKNSQESQYRTAGIGSAKISQLGQKVRTGQQGQASYYYKGRTPGRIFISLALLV